MSRNHELGYFVVIDELENIIHNRDSHLNLTHKYYALKALKYMEHANLEIKWNKFLYQPPNNMSFIEGACLISQWYQPAVSKCTWKVSAEIENIATLILEKIKAFFPCHPIVKQGILKEDRITESLWSPHHCKNVIYCINSVIFEDLKFKGIEAGCCCFTNEALIDKVLKKRLGMNLTLGIIYSAVAAKLGVCCEPVNFHFLLKWLEHPGLNEKERYTYIDVMESGASKTFNDIFKLVPHQIFPLDCIKFLTPVQFCIKCALYLVELASLEEEIGEISQTSCNALELVCVLSPKDIDHKITLIRTYMHLKININKALSMLQEIAAAIPESFFMRGSLYQSILQTLESQRISIPPIKSKVQLRIASAGIKYAVGMIIRHKVYDFRCVIYGWDYECSASQDWIKRMGKRVVKELHYKSEQPFYYVLLEDGTNRYVAQENLEIDDEEMPITHLEIGRYFEKFCDSYYMPNEQTLAEYPEDVKYREEVLKQQSS